MKYQFRVPYFGELSENSYKLPNHATKPHVRKWMSQLASNISNSKIEKAPNYIIGVHGFFADERRPDLPNLFKVVLDAVADGLNVNDKHFQARDDGHEVGYFKPELLITVEPRLS